jgi:hypothetical protein
MRVKCPACFSRCETKEREKNRVAPCPKCRVKLLIPGFADNDTANNPDDQQFLRAIVYNVSVCAVCRKKFETLGSHRLSNPICPSCHAKNCEVEAASFLAEASSNVEASEVKAELEVNPKIESGNLPIDSNEFSSQTEPQTVPILDQSNNGGSENAAAQVSSDVSAAETIYRVIAGLAKRVDEILTSLPPIDPTLIKVIPSHSSRWKVKKESKPPKPDGPTRIVEPPSEQVESIPIAESPPPAQNGSEVDSKENPAVRWPAIFRCSPFRCECGHSIDSNEHRIGDTVVCTTCQNEFTFRLASEDFLVVMPGLTLQDYEFHAIQIVEYAKLLFRTPKELESAARDLRRTMRGIMQFGRHARLEENSANNDLGVAGFLARYSKAQSKGIVPDSYLVKDVAGTSYSHSSISNDSRFIDSKLAELNDLVSKIGD